MLGIMTLREQPTMAQSPFAAPGDWLKGNLHTHSNKSDGQPSPQQIVDLYAERAYDFLAITDHNRLTDVNELDSKGLTLIPGSELNGGRAELGQHYHLVLIGQHREVAPSPEMSIQQIIDLAHTAGEVCWIAHPSWCSISGHELFALNGIIGIEVYNTTCHHGIGRGESAVQWDEMLGRGLKVLGLAVDDAHWHYPDAIGGWIWVKSEQRDAASIVAAIRDGLFYASCGPVIEDVRFDGRDMTLRCSPAQEVRLVHPNPGMGWTSFRLGRPGPYTEVQWAIPDAWALARIEVIDELGRKAWTNPFYFD
jgi:hypothetical protein